MGCTPLFLNADPHSTGTQWLAMVPRRSAWRRSSAVISSSAAYFSNTVSSKSDRTSRSLARHASASATRSSGTSVIVHSSPFSPSASAHTRPFMLMRSTTPRKWPSAPMGTCTTATLACNRSSMESTAAKKSAPMRSILLMKQMRGTPYLLAWRHTVSDWGSTPETASNTATAPSSTRSDRSTSTVKSTWPGVSMMLMVWSRHRQVVAAEVMVIPRSCSWTIQSMVAAPSWTSPIL